MTLASAKSFVRGDKSRVCIGNMTEVADVETARHRIYTAMTLDQFFRAM